MRKQVKLNGITTIPNHEDGDAIVCVNLRKHNGTLKPVPPRKKVKELSILYDFVYIHDTPNSVQNWIGVKGGQLWHIKSANNSQLSDDPILPLSSAPSITQIGNILNIVDSSGLKYLFWYENEYKVINTDFDGEQTDTVLGPVKVDLKVSRKGTSTERDVSMYYSDSNHHGAYNYDLNSAEAIAQNTAAKGLFTKAIGLGTAEGGLHGFVLACTAIELYDGSYILHSNPVLLGQSLDAYTRYEDTFNYLTNKATFVDTALVDESAVITEGVGQSLLIPSGFTNDTENKCYSGKSNKQYRGTANQGTSGLTLDAAIHEAPNLYAQLVQPESTGSSSIYVTISTNELQFKVNSNITETLKPLIKSVSVFISPEISIYKRETCKFIGACYFGYYGSVRYKSYNWQPEIKTNAEIIEELKSNQIFYKVHEITFDELQSITPETWINIDLKGKLGDNLANQERLPVDNFSHHKLVPVSQYVYNSRLHAMDYKMLLSRGWPVNYFYQNTGVGQFYDNEDRGAVFAQGWIEYIEVTIKTTTGVVNVVRVTPELQVVYLKMINLSAMISYPDSRATWVTLFRQYYDSSEQKYWVEENKYPLKASETHNFAYYINPELKPINTNTGEYKAIEDSIPSEKNRTLIYSNGLKVSALANPFYFANENTYKVGNKTILGASSNAMRMSEGQYGQFPLYLFCTDGIFALNVGTDIVYTNITPVSNELAVSNKLLPTPYGVVFFGQRGLYIVAGQRVERLTPQLELIQPYYNLNLTSNFTIDIERDFTKFIQEATALTYDFSNSELHICNNKYDYTLVINIEQKHIYISTQTWNGATGQYLIAGTKIIDLAQYEREYADIALITRPINFGTNDMKNVERTVIRGMFKEALNLNLANLSSLDSVNFIPRQSKGLKEGNYIDLNLGLISNKTRYSIFALSGTLHSESEITNLEYEVNAEYKGIR